MKSISVLLFLWHKGGNKNKNTATKISVWASCQLAVSKASIRVFRLGAPLFLIYSLYFLMYNSSQRASSVFFLLRRKKNKTKKKQCDPMLNKVKIPASAAAKERPRTKSRSAGGGKIIATGSGTRREIKQRVAAGARERRGGRSRARSVASASASHVVDGARETATCDGGEEKKGRVVERERGLRRVCVCVWDRGSSTV